MRTFRSMKERSLTSASTGQALTKPTSTVRPSSRAGKQEAPIKARQPGQNGHDRQGDRFPLHRRRRRHVDRARNEAAARAETSRRRGE